MMETMHRREPALSTFARTLESLDADDRRDAARGLIEIVEDVDSDAVAEALDGVARSGPPRAREATEARTAEVVADTGTALSLLCRAREAIAPTEDDSDGDREHFADIEDGAGCVEVWEHRSDDGTG
jgi:hypothetical protein